MFKGHISLLNNAFMSLQIFCTKRRCFRWKTTLDLCSIISDSEIDNENFGDDEDDDEKDDVLTSKYKLPEIPNKLKAYRARVTNENNKVSWIAKGVKYTKEDIQRYDEQAIYL